MDWDQLAKFQTAFVGIIGFGGVILTLNRNARLAREAREHQEKQAEVARQSSIMQSRLIVSRALAAELRQLYTFLEKLKFNNTSYMKFLLDGEPSQPPVYQALLKEIGILTEPQLIITVQAYSAASRLQNLLKDALGNEKITPSSIEAFNKLFAETKDTIMAARSLLGTADPSVVFPWPMPDA